MVKVVSTLCTPLRSGRPTIHSFTTAAANHNNKSDEMRTIIRFVIYFFCFLFVPAAAAFGTETYRSRNRRAALGFLAPSMAVGRDGFSNRALNVLVAEKQILKEFGPKACVLEEPCKFHAHRPAAKGEQPDWDDILR